MDAQKSLHSLIPAEFLEPNWRLYSFIFLVAFTIWLLLEFPVKPYKGIIDPFYSPTILVLPFVGLFRLTCYAYRKDYHRHVFKHPVSCALDSRGDSAKRTYSGETGFFRVENLHRYFMYFSVLILPFFFYDFYVSITFGGGLIIRLASLILLANALMVTIWVFSCHAVRHLTGGRIDCYGCKYAGKQRNSFFNFQSKLNAHHEALAWTSLIMFVFVDLYIRALAAGIPLDVTFIHILHI
ncbi:MAG: succinate dehydrogenase [Candidatus Marsarchaeota archaeon]|nr:succinate dehydrogenase [Candidatus Marsarchaeota archaeon]